MKRIIAFMALCLALVGCKHREALLPNVSGKAGEIVVMMEKSDWEGSLGNAVREVLAADCPYLPVREPLYSLINVTPSNFIDLFKVHRNIVYFDIDPQVTENKVTYLHDRWAQPQCIVYITATDSEHAQALFTGNTETITNFIEQAERDRVIANTLRYEEHSLYPQVAEIFGGSPHFPMGYKLKKKNSDFVWIADEKQYTNQAVLIYKYPAASGVEDFTLDRIIAHRNEILKANVPGMFENTYMTTGQIPAPTMEYMKYKGREFAQTRGWWEVENDYMAGPFVSQSFYSPDGQYIIVEEAFLYAPKYDKRQYLRQVESLLYSWEWVKDEKEESEN